MYSGAAPAARAAHQLFETCDAALACATVLLSTPWNGTASAYTVNLSELPWTKAQRSCTGNSFPRTTTLSLCSELSWFLRTICILP